MSRPGFAITEYHDTKELYKKLENLLSQPIRPIQRGEIEKYTTNVASYLSFGLLAGQIWDGLVVMGYNHDHIFYQNLWFNILNQGYQMPAIA